MTKGDFVVTVIGLFDDVLIPSAEGILKGMMNKGSSLQVNTTEICHHPKIKDSFLIY